MEPPQSRARVIIVSPRGRNAGTGPTLSLVPRWTSDRAASEAAAERSRTEARFERGGAKPAELR
jgi:hypothetical protein